MTSYLTDQRSPLLNLLLMGAGLHNDDWGDQTNDNLVALEAAVAGVGTISGLTGGTQGLTQAQALPGILVFKGALTSNAVVTVPSLSKTWLFDNQTTGAYKLTVKTTSGSGVMVGQGTVVSAYCDGTDVKTLTIPGTPIGIVEEYHGIELPDSRYDWANGQSFDRASEPQAFNALTRTTTLTVGGGATVCACTENLTSKGLIGSIVEGPGVPSNTTVTAVAPTTVTLSNPTTGATAAQTVRFFPHGNGDGATTFSVPDRSECVCVGASRMGGRAPAGRITATSMASLANLGNRVGADRHKLTVAELAAHGHGITDAGHTHGITDPGHTHGYGRSGNNNTSVQGGGAGTANAGINENTATGTNTTGITVNSATTGITVNSAGGDGTHNNLQPTLVCNYIIRMR